MSKSASNLPPVLDPCCASRMWWFDKQNPNAIYGDRRSETITVVDRSHGKSDGQRVLRPRGTLIFKWNETQVKIREILELCPIAPLFGNTSGRKAGTHWIVFMKPEDCAP